MLYTLDCNVISKIDSFIKSKKIYWTNPSERLTLPFWYNNTRSIIGVSCTFISIRFINFYNLTCDILYYVNYLWCINSQDCYPEVWLLTISWTQTQTDSTSAPAGARDRGGKLRSSSCRGGRATDTRYHSRRTTTPPPTHHHNHPPGALCLLLIQDRLHFSSPNLWNFFQRAASAARWRAFLNLVGFERCLKLC